MLRHIVFMKFKKGVDELQIEDLKSSLGSLPGKIDEIKGFEFGPDILKSERSYDFALVSTFTDLDSLKNYQVHPEHIPVIQKVRGLCEAILVVDFELP
ncbi:MAG: Dabb family protein [Syntrophus sp. (in: bacteria)]